MTAGTDASTNAHLLGWLWLAGISVIYLLSRTTRYRLAAHAYVIASTVLLISVPLRNPGIFHTFVTVSFFYILSIYIVTVFNRPTNILWVLGIAVACYYLCELAEMPTLTTINAIATLLMISSLTTLLNHLRKRNFDKRLNMESQVTEQRLNIEYLKKTEASNKLMLLGEISSGIAHEIKNPLTAIAGKALVLKTRASNGKLTHDECIRHTEQILKTVELVSKIITNVQRMAHSGDQSQREVKPLQSMIQTAVEMTREKLRRYQVNLEEPKIDPSIRLNCDEVQITQVMINLISNAIDAVAALDKKWIRIEAHREDPGDHIFVRFIDSGQGIPRDIQRKIMTPFYTTKSQGEGTGMGLSFCRRIIEQHDGEFGIDTSFPNTCFYFRLAITDVKAVERQAS
ncbi:sensor histidine kinase [Pseudobacteriovorax antillogorgiicola]|nr:HAMP domain-containing sensor histidine kinase [Pseudobacteriovorax antillogorgiicola]